MIDLTLRSKDYSTVLLCDDMTGEPIALSADARYWCEDSGVEIPHIDVRSFRAARIIGWMTRLRFQDKSHAMAFKIRWL